MFPHVKSITPGHVAFDGVFSIKTSIKCENALLDPISQLSACVDNLGRDLCLKLHEY